MMSYKSIKLELFLIILLTESSLSLNYSSGGGLEPRHREKSEMKAATSDHSLTILSQPLIQFTIDFFSSARQEQQNVIVSPVSIHSALNLVLLAAKSDSQTESELIDALGYQRLGEPVERAHESYAKLISLFKKLKEKSQNVQDTQSECWSTNDESSQDVGSPLIDFWTMGIAKKIADLQPAYVERVKKFYSSSIELVHDDVEAENLASKVNKWGSEAGFGKELLSPDDLKKEFTMMLLSAVRVEASWFTQFTEHDFDELFFNYGKHDQLVKNRPGLSVDDLHGKYIKFSKTANYQSRWKTGEYQEMFTRLSQLEFHIIEVPLRGDVSFTIFEPLRSGTGKELTHLVDQLLAYDPARNHTNLSEALQMIDTDEASNLIDYLRIPVFKFENEIDLQTPLKSMGLQRIFDKEYAELTKAANHELYVDEAKHRAMIEVNKFGVKSAGYTQIRAVGLTSLLEAKPLRIEVKHPFMFVMRYEKLPLFAGQLVHVL